MKLEACALTDAGRRRKKNEDCVSADCETGLFIVADGMGGHAAGEVASRMAVDILRDRYTLYAGAPSAEQALADSFGEATRSILAHARTHPAHQGMGTTLSTLFFRDNQLHLAHVGDSRIYRLRHKRLEQLSIDHSLIAEQVRTGLISAAEARNSQMRNILLQAIGMEEQVEVFMLRQPVAAGDLYLLCSDGLTDMLEDEKIAGLLDRPCAAKQLAQDLIDTANEAGGRDNISVIVIQIKSLEIVQAP